MFEWRVDKRRPPAETETSADKRVFDKAGLNVLLKPSSHSRLKASGVLCSGSSGTPNITFRQHIKRSLFSFEEDFEFAALWENSLFKAVFFFLILSLVLTFESSSSANHKVATQCMLMFFDCGRKGTSLTLNAAVGASSSHNAHQL